ncbi:MAG: AAA family ATPase [Candidatus Binatus sp.]|uniref:AAA family ATPase n=1 Tax=Candidatus Binatus sp. TaxID=2811406 RepID=UPI00271CA180|nr:AAA family ATPase [Candidatus Binatus sp.]MDO8432933.1 AAA family ATPase [Candidatus Binatus sp.]
MPDPAIAKLAKIREELNRMFLERADLIDGAIVAMLSANHLLIIGPPGTAKSMLADELCNRIDGAAYFQWLLTKFSTPEEIFGAVSLKGLEEDDYRRVTSLKLPEAHIAFLDEIFTANSSILNALLTIINERIFHNGRARIKVPLITMFGASNELPDEDELTALYDRFMLRFMADYITEEHGFIRMLAGGAERSRTTITFDELRALQERAAAVDVPGAILQSIVQIRRELAREQIVVSDRRWKNSLSVLRAHALLRGREAVIEDDLMFLAHVLWKDPEERPKVVDTLKRIVRGYQDKLQELVFESRELREYAEGVWESEELRQRAMTEANAKLASIVNRFDTLLKEASDSGRAIADADTMRTEVKSIQQALFRRSVGD